MLRKIVARRPLGCPGVVVAAASASLAGQRRWMNMNRSVQTRWEMDSQNAAQTRTDYDFDREQWSKQMKFASMDCIMDPDITPIRYSSLSGMRKAFRRFITMRKLMERRPDFDKAQLQQLFVQLRTLSRGTDTDCLKTLQRLTTHGEASRIAKEIKQRMNEDFTKKSWKALRNRSTASTYEMEVDSFDLVTCYMGQMAQDDWLQVTYRCDFRERASKEFDWEKVTEYPVFEIRLGDGFHGQSNYPIIVVGVMRKDGTRYGKDAQDAAALRKQFDRSSKWF